MRFLVFFLPILQYELISQDYQTKKKSSHLEDRDCLKVPQRNRNYRINEWIDR